MRKIIQNIPLGKIGEQIDIALNIKFLIENDYITGEIIDVNGGLFMQ